ncbi:MAG: hypothetical protein QM496_11780 [Verrucomicrobiota bacterium]
MLRILIWLSLIFSPLLAHAQGQANTRTSAQNPRLQRILLQGGKDPGKVIAELQTLAKDKQQIPFVADALSQLAQLDYPTMSQRLDLASSMLAHLDEWKKIANPNPKHFAWLPILAYAISSDFYDGDLSYGALIALDQELPQDAKNEEKVLQAFKKRRLLYRQLCEKAISIPSLSAGFFAKLVELSHYWKISDEHLLPLCESSLKNLTRKNLHTYFGRLEVPEIQLGNNELQWKTKAAAHNGSGPIPWIIEYAFLSQNKSLIKKMALIPADKKLGEAIAMLSEYYFCPAENLADSIDKVEQFSHPSKPDESFWSPQIQWIMIRRALSLRPDMNQAFEPADFIAPRLEKGTDLITLQFAFDQIRLISMKKGPVEIYAFLTKIAQAMPIDLKKIKQEGSEAPELVAFLNQVASSPGCLYSVLKFAKKHGQAPFIQIDLNPHRDGPARYYDITLSLYRSPLYNSAENISTFPVAEFPRLQLGRRYDSVAGFKLHRLLKLLCGESNIPSRKKLRDTFSKIDTFGGKLLVAVFEEQATDAVLDFFGQHIEELEKLPEQKKIELAVLAKDLICPACLTPLSNEKRRATLHWIMKTAKTGEFARLQKYRTARSFAELDMQAEEALHLVGEDLKRALGFDWRVAYAAFENIARLGEAAVASGEIEIREQTFTSQLLAETLYAARSVDAFAFMVEALQSESLPTLFSYKSRFHAPIMHLSHKAEGQEAKLERFTTFVRLAHGEIDQSSDMALTLPFFYHLLAIIDFDVRPPPYIVDWVDKEATVKSYPKLAPSIKLATELLSSKRNGPTADGLKDLAQLLQAGDHTDSTKFMFIGMVSYIDARESGQLLKFNLQQLAFLWKKYGSDVKETITSGTLRHLESKRNLLSPEVYKKEWGKAEKDLAAAYEQYVLIPDRKAKRFVLEDESPFVKEDLLRILTQNGRKTAAKKMLTQQLAKTENPFQKFCHLIRAGSYPDAATILKAEWVTMLNTAAVHVTFDQTLADQVKPFLKTIEADPEWLKWLAEYMLLRTEEPNGHEPAKGWPDSRKRLQDVGQRLRLNSFPDEISRLRVLLSFLEFSDLKKMYHESLLAASRKTSFQAVNQEVDKKIQRLLLETYLYGVQYDVLNGKEEILTQLLKQNDQLELLHTTENRQAANNQRNPEPQPSPPNWLYAITSIVTSPAVIKKCRSVEFAQKILPFYSEIGKRKAFGMMDGNSSNFLAGLIFLHLVLDKLPETRHFIVELPKGSVDYFRDFFQGADRNTTLSRVFMHLYSPRYHAPNRTFYADPEQRGSPLKLPPPVLKTVETLRGLGKNFDFESPSDSKVKAFLSADTVAQTGYPPTRFLFEIGRLMQDQYDLDQRREIYDKSLALVKVSLETDKTWPRTYQNGWGPAGQTLNRLSFSIPDPDWRAIALLADILWNDTPDNFSLAENSGIKRTVTRMWQQAVSQSSKKPDAKTLSRMLASLRAALPADEKKWGDSAVFRPIFFELCESINDSKYLAETLQQNQQNPDPLFIEFRLAAQMWLAQQKAGQAPRQFGENTGESDWSEAALQVLTPDTHPALRAFFIQHLLNRTFPACPRSLQQKIFDDTASIMNQEGPVNGWMLTHVLNLFNPSQKDELWQNQAEKFITGWQVLNLKQDPSWRNYQPFSPTLLTMLQLYFQAADASATGKHFMDWQAALSGEATCLALLLREDRHDLALQWLSLPRKNLILPSSAVSPYVFQISYDNKIHQQITNFLNKVKSEEDRFTVRLCLAGLTDPETLPSHLPSQKQRLTTLANSYTPTTFKSETKQHNTMLALSRYWQQSEKIIHLLDVYFTPERMDEAFSSAKGYTAVRQNLAPLVALVYGKSSYTNDKHALPDYLARSKKLLSEGDQFAAINDLVGTLQKLILNELEKSDADNKASLLKLHTLNNQLLPQLPYRRMSPNWGSLLVSQIIMADLLDQKNDLDVWRSQLDRSQAAMLKRLLTLNQKYLPTAHKAYFKNQDKLNRAQQTLQSDPWFKDARSNKGLGRK